jgi:preprotein translocase subunit Sec63
MGSKMEGTSTPAIRRDPYEVLSVSKESTDQEIKTAYRKLALKSVSSFSSLFNSILSLLLAAVSYFRFLVIY